MVKPTRDIIFIFQSTAVNLATVLANKKALDTHEKGSAEQMASGIIISCLVFISFPYIATFLFWLAEIIGEAIGWIIKKISNLIIKKNK